LEECRFEGHGLVHAAFRLTGLGVQLLDLTSKLRAANLGHDDVGDGELSIGPE
jgi:hypothetical protein